MGHLPAFDAATVAATLERFLAGYAERAKAPGFVLGLSGGVDSAVSAALAVKAVGKANVLGLVLPHRDSAPTDAAHAAEVARTFGLATETVDITRAVEAVATACEHPVEGMTLGNVKSRMRMVLLYAHANATGRLVLGTGNKSELMQGYFTKFGDGGADVYPLGDVYKTHVWELARHLRVPSSIVEKPPSAGLFPGQTDEGEMGISYTHLDEVLAGLEAGHTGARIARDLGLAPEVVAKVEDRLYKSEHKRTSLVVPKLGFKTPGLDWRLPRQAVR